MKRFLVLLCAAFMLTISVRPMPVSAAPQGIVMNFSDVDISTMVKFISELTGKNFVLDERVKGKISIFSPSRLTVDEAFALFTSVLELKGFTLAQSGKIYKIVPLTSAKQSSMQLVDGTEPVTVSDAYLARVFTLDQISSQDALPFLQPLVSRDGHIASFGPGNMLLVVDAASNLQKIANLLTAIDTAQRRDGGELIYLQHSNADGVAAILREWLGGKGTRAPNLGSGGQQPISTAGVQIFPDQRLNALLVFASEQDKQDIRNLVKLMDIPPPTDSSKINVVFLEHTDAAEMAKVLEGVIKGISAKSTTRPGAAAATTPQMSPIDSGNITITADETTNALVIMASPTDYNNILQVVKKLDRRSKQVFVQVLIAEVSPSKSNSLGTQAGALAAGTLGKYFQGGGLYDPFGAFGQILGGGTSGTGAGISGLIGDRLNDTDRPVTGAALLQAMEAEGMLNILSTPNILTTDNKEAEINVGENVPFQGATNTIVGGGTTSSVERKDIGINLKIKPQVSEGEYIRMDIYQEISAVKNDKGQAIDLVTTKRSAKTSVVVRDKETIVIGGLIQDTEDTSITKIPILGDIPLLGWLFKVKSKTRQKTNLMILLTPQIVKDDADLYNVSREQRSRFDSSSKEFGKVDVEKTVTEQFEQIKHNEQDKTDNQPAVENE